MEKQYKHITMEERELISKMHHESKKQSEIARFLGRDKGTISRELQRNASTEYDCYTPCQAQRRCDERRKKASRRPRLKNETVRIYVREKLALGWSPELIAGRLSLEQPEQSLSYEAIYQYIYHPKTKEREELIACLRRAHKKRRNKSIGRKARKTKIPNRVPIDARPKSVESRRYYGHWEGDSLVSRKSLAALNSLTERKSRFLFLTKLNRKGAEETRNAVVSRLHKLPARMRRTLTLDNGTENAQHEEITARIKTKCYFAHPYASWQRGTNEHINGLIRWYLPKGTDFCKISEEQIAQIESLINNRPRKCLGFKTPFEVVASVVALQG
jgi:IS30 family transposase